MSTEFKDKILTHLANKQSQRFVDSEFKKQMINHRDYIKNFLLTDKQIKILDIIEKLQVVDSTTLSKILGVSLQNASSTLYVLYEKTYLNREDVGCPSGGSQYQYFIQD